MNQSEVAEERPERRPGIETRGAGFRVMGACLEKAVDDLMRIVIDPLRGLNVPELMPWTVLPGCVTPSRRRCGQGAQVRTRSRAL